MRRVSRKKARQGVQWRRVRRTVMIRSEGRCEARIPSVCTGTAEHVHHLRLQSQGGADEEANLLASCWACHAHIHANPAWSAEHGFIWRAS